MRFLGTRVMAIVAIAGFASPAAAATWSGTRLEGGMVRSIVVDGSTLYAIAGIGVFKSTNGGGRWDLASTGLPSQVIYSLAVAASDTLYAGTGFGVFKTVDGGANWGAVGTGPPSGVNALLVGSGSKVYAATQSGVYKTTDDSVWKPAGLDGNVVWALAKDASGDLYAGTQGTVFKSTDGGLSWNPANKGLPSSDMLSFTFDASGAIFVATSYGPYKSTDGESWSPANTGLAATNISSLASHGNVIYAGTYFGGILRSTNGGASWVAPDEPPSTPRIFRVAVDGNGVVYAGTSDAGMFKSTDGGARWQMINRGLTGLGVSELMIDPMGTLYAGTGVIALEKSGDGGQSWTRADFALSGYVSALTYDLAGAIYAGTYAGIFRSTTSGANWGLVSDTDLIYAMARDPAGTLFAGGAGGILYKSANGTAWTPANTGLPAADVQAMTADEGGNLYVGTNTSGIYKSVNGGGSWNPVTGPETTIYVLASDGEGGLYAGGSGYLWKSLNGGASWSIVLFHNVYTLVIDAKGIAYGGSSDGVRRSVDGGATWQVVNAGLPFKYVSTLAVDAGNVVYAGTGGGLFKLLPLCGDGMLDDGEQCDDGNTTGGDCCSATCALTSCGTTTTTSTVRPSTTTVSTSLPPPTSITTTTTTTSTAGSTIETSTSTTSIASTSTSTTPTTPVRAPVCGDGTVDPGEECDDGDRLSNIDCCDRNCRFRSAGSDCGDPAESVCDGADECDGRGRCDPNPKGDSVVCRQADPDNPCDVGVHCDGENPDCPAGHGSDEGCGAELDEESTKKIALTCFALAGTGGGVSTCEAAAFEALPQATVTTGLPRLGEQVTKKKHKRLKFGGGVFKTRTLKLHPNARGKKRLKENGGTLPVVINVTVRHGGRSPLVQLLAMLRSKK